MSRIAKDAWVSALRRLEGCSDAEILWNEAAHRWEFRLRGADGVFRSQFWGWFSQRIDPTTGLHPFRELDDQAMEEALRNLERTYIANRFDGAGTTDKAVRRNIRFNTEHQRSFYRDAGTLFADMAADRGKRLRGALQVSVPAQIVSAAGAGSGDKRASSRMG